MSPILRKVGARASKKVVVKPQTSKSDGPKVAKIISAAEKPALPPPPKTIVLTGLKSAMQTFLKRPGDIHQLFFTRDVKKQLMPLTRYLASVHKLFKEVPPEELKKISGGNLHEGVAVKIIPPHLHPWAPSIAESLAEERLVLVLDGIGNPNNFGAMVRTAAFLGVKNVIITDHTDQALVSGSAMRVAEGGFELIRLIRGSFPKIVSEMQNVNPKVKFLGAANSKDSIPYRNLKPVKSDQIFLVLGNEETGLSKSVLELIHEKIKIPGIEQMESLNVSAAAAILMSHFVD